MKFRFLTALTGTILSLAAWPAGAVVYNSSTGLVAPGTTITFDGGLAQNAPLGASYGGSSVSFLGLFQDYTYGGDFPNTGSAASGTGINFLVGENNGHGSFEIDFAGPVREAVFTLVTNASPTPNVIQSFYGATLVETANTFNFIGLANTSNIYGFTNSYFDRIVVTPETTINQGALIDNLQFTTAVPEPATWAMMILGFAGVGFMAYRRKNKASAFRFA
jgi:PEP-CTERM motif